MKRLMLLLATLILLVVAVGVLMQRYPGVVLIAVGDRQIEMALGFAALLWLLSGFVIAMLILLAQAGWELFGIGAWQRLQSRLAQRRLLAGYRACVDGDWPRAARLFGSAARGPWQAIGKTAQALALDAAGDSKGSHDSLTRLAALSRGKLAAQLLLARWQLQQGDANKARLLLDNLADSAPHNRHRLSLLADTLIQQQDWSTLVDQLPALKGVLPGKRYQALALRARAALIDAVARAPVDNDSRLRALQRTWKSIPAAEKTDADLVANYARHLINHGEAAAALSLLEKTLAQHWDDRLLAVFDLLPADSDNPLTQAEAWAAQQPGNATLQLTCGRLALRAQLWGKARDFFAAAARLGNATALAELARLSQALGEPQQAAAALDQRASLIGATLPALPLPTPKRQPTAD